MNWTTERPTAPGFYWWRSTEGDKEILWVQKWAGELIATRSGSAKSDRVEVMHGEFAGPIPQPT